jgi:hypothetical protein
MSVTFPSMQTVQFVHWEGEAVPSEEFVHGDVAEYHRQCYHDGVLPAPDKS